MKLELIATATFGLEAVVKREIENMGYKTLSVEDGRVTFLGDERAICRANIWLRTSDRVQIKMAEFKAPEFEDLFQQIKGIAWEEWIPIDGNFVVNGVSVKSKLSSVPAVQSVSEKAVVERLKEFYGVERFEKSGAKFSLKVSLLKDRALVTMDTTGESLHRRGYRRLNVEAPIKETMAAAMLELSFWKAGRILVDPCCGSGTIPIEAAMIGRNIAPGISRSFVSEDWDAIPKALWKEERTRAYGMIDNDCELTIYGSDVDPAAIKIARINAEEAGVDDCIEFAVSDISDFPAPKDDAGKIAEAGVVVTNPPYGERIGDKKTLEHIYEAYGKFFAKNPTWSLFVITPDKEIEQKAMGREADRRRKLYNGRLEVCYYQFHGEKKK